MDWLESVHIPLPSLDGTPLSVSPRTLRDPVTNVRLEEPDESIYLPSTPTVAFLDAIERFIALYLR